MNTMLEFILTSAIRERPFTRFELLQHPNLDLEWLEQKGYLRTTGRIANHVMLGNRRCDVEYNRLAQRTPYSYWDDEVLVPIPNADVLEEVKMSYEPIAKLLAEHLGCSPTPEIIIPNKLWKLGAPRMTYEDIFLARNAGADSNVRREIASRTKEGMTLYCFGLMPESSISKASICNLCDFLTWNGSDIQHIEKLPSGIVKVMEGYSLGELPENLFRNKGGVWELRYNYSELYQLPSSLKGCIFLARLLDKPHYAFDIEELDPPPPMEKPILDVEELLNNFNSGLDTYMPTLDENAISAFREYRRTQIQRLNNAKDSFDNDEEEKAQEQLDAITNFLNENLQKNGKPRNMNKTARRPSQAFAKDVRTVIKRIKLFNPTLAKHLKDSLTLGEHPIYAPKEDITWNVIF